MGRAFTLPDLGEGLHEAEIVAWHVSVGDHVVTDQPLVTVETDKAIVEVPSPQSGHIESLHGEPGDIVRVGQPLVEFAAGEAEDAGAIVGVVEKADAVHERAPKDRPQVQPEHAAEARSQQPPEHAAEPGPPRERGHGAGVAAAPAIRRLAESLGVDIAAIAGSGVDGSVTRADVEAAAGGRAVGPAPAVPPAAEAGVEPAAAGPGALRGVRRAMFQSMTRAGREVVHATVTDEADVESWRDGEDVTARLIRAIVAGCRASPALNAWFETATGSRTVHEQIDLGLAVETDDGLFVPVVGNVGERDVAEIRTDVEALKQAVAERSVPRERLTGQTITLSNFGMVGGRFADLVVVPPQVAILGAGRIDRRPVAVADQVAVHRVMPLSLSFDHRVVTGVEAARFLGAVVADLQKSN